LTPPTPLGLASSLQMVPVRRNVPPVESDKGAKVRRCTRCERVGAAVDNTKSQAKNALHNGWGVVADQNENKKKYMEDAYRIEPELCSNYAFFAVYDGHEGREAVDYVRERLHEHVRAALLAGTPPLDALANAYKYVSCACDVCACVTASHSRAHRKIDADLGALEVRKSGACAVTALLFTDGKQRVLYCANAGDSRATIVKGKEATRVSYDHKASDPDEVKRVTDLVS
jgi:protein phosphatase PTC1